MNACEEIYLGFKQKTFCLILHFQIRCYFRRELLFNKFAISRKIFRYLKAVFAIILTYINLNIWLIEISSFWFGFLWRLISYVYFPPDVYILLFWICTLICRGKLSNLRDIIHFYKTYWLTVPSCLLKLILECWSVVSCFLPGQPNPTTQWISHTMLNKKDVM